MNEILVCVSLIIMVVVLIFTYINLKKYKEIKNNYELLKKDNNNFVSRSLMEYNLITKLCKDEVQILEEFKKSSVDSEFLKYENSLREICNNIEVIADEEAECNDLNINLKDTFKKLENKNVLIEIDDFPFNLIYDEVKLLSALKMVIKKSIDNDVTGKIKINVTMVEKKNCNMKIKIYIENIKLSNQKTDVLNKMFKSHSIDFVEDPELMIIRANLFCLKSKIDITENKKVVSMNIDLPVIKQKENRLTPRALIVDDSKHTAIMNQDILKELGVDADVVFSAEECLEKVKDNIDDYDIIFTDNQMPNMCGPELLRELKSLNEFNLPVIIVTGDHGEEHYFKEICGFNEYIEKPLDRKKANKIIKKYLNN